MNLFDRLKLKSLVSFIIYVIDKLITLYNKVATGDQKPSSKKTSRLFKRRKKNENN